MPSSGLAGLMMRPTQYADRLPDPPAGHVEIPTGVPTQQLWVPPEMAGNDALLQLILDRILRQQQESPAPPTWRSPAPGLKPFFAGGQRAGKPLRSVEHWPTAPSADAYEIASDDADADRILSEGGKPIIWWRDTEPGFSDLAKAQEEQYAAPGLDRVPMFSTDASGTLRRTNPDYEPRRVMSGSAISSTEAGTLGGLGTLMRLLGGR